MAIVKLDTVAVTQYTIGAITISSGRSTFIDPIPPASCSGTFTNDALTATTGVGSLIEVLEYGNTRFKGTITNISRGRYETAWTATSVALGAYARALAPEFTVRQIPYSGGTRNTHLSYVALDVLYQAGLLTDAEFLDGADQNIAGLGAVDYISVTTDIGIANLQANAELLTNGSTIPAGTVLDQLNYLAGHTRAGIVWEARGTSTITVEWTREYTEDLIVGSSYTQWGTEVTQSLELLANKVTVNYSTGRSVYNSLSSIASYGLFGLDITTNYSSLINAAGLAYSTLAGRYKPRWLAVPLVVDIKNSGAARTNVYNMEPGRGWALGGLSDIPYQYRPERTFVEGYVETLTTTSHTAEVYAFDYIYTNTGDTWADVPALLTWAGVIDPMVTWYDMIGTNL